MEAVQKVEQPKVQQSVEQQTPVQPKIEPVKPQNAQVEEKKSESEKPAEKQETQQPKEQEGSQTKPNRDPYVFHYFFKITSCRRRKKFYIKTPRYRNYNRRNFDKEKNSGENSYHRKE